MSEDIVDELLREARFGVLGWHNYCVKIARRAAIEILELRRELAVQWRDWDDVTELDAKLAAVQSVAQQPSDPPTTPMTPNDDTPPMTPNDDTKD